MYEGLVAAEVGGWVGVAWFFGGVIIGVVYACSDDCLSLVLDGAFVLGSFRMSILLNTSVRYASHVMIKNRFHS